MQAAKNTAQDLKNTFSSGQPGTTGREVFEGSTATGPGTTQAGASGQAPAQDLGAAHGSGQHHGHHGHHGHNEHGIGSTGLTGSTGTSGTGAGVGSGVGHTGTGHSGLTGSTGSGLSGSSGLTGSAAGAGVGSGLASSGHHGHHGHHHGSHPAHTGDHGQGVSSGLGSGGQTDRVGKLDQDIHKYESTGPGGPTTSGAAGTDRFDTDKSRLTSTGATATGTGDKDNTGVNSTGTHRYTTHPDTDTGLPEGESGEKHKSNPIVNALTTSDKDFTNRDRLGKGAYNDDHAHFKSNTSGPDGNTALTGREGTFENNPVAQAQSRGENVGAGSGAGASSTAAPATHGDEHKKGFVEKVKDALS